MLTTIGNSKTPGRPIELAYDADTGLPDATKVILLVGHRAATGASGTSADFVPVTINNSASKVAASGEAAEKFGQGSEIQAMILAAIEANTGASTFPQIKAIALPAAETGFGPSDEALLAAERVPHEFIVSPYDGLNEPTLTAKIQQLARLLSGATRTDSGQYGTFGVVANQDEQDPANLSKLDTEYLAPVWGRDSAPVRSLGALAAMYAAVLAANGVPFNPVDDLTIQGLAAPVNEEDYITMGANAESETALQNGWAPLRVKPNGEVSIVRSVTARLTVDADGVTEVLSYFDVQDFQVLFFNRKAKHVRFSQPDFKRRKASKEVAGFAKDEMIRIDMLFQDQGMFQAVKELSKEYKVERNISDRSRFDYLTPVNVIPGLHQLAGRILATTKYDTLSF